MRERRVYSVAGSSNEAAIRAFWNSFPKPNFWYLSMVTFSIEKCFDEILWPVVQVFHTAHYISGTDLDEQKYDISVSHCENSVTKSIRTIEAPRLAYSRPPAAVPIIGTYVYPSYQVKRVSFRIWYIFSNFNYVVMFPCFIWKILIISRFEYSTRVPAG